MDTTDGPPATEPGAGEKRCPYCAETIKAAAIRCRWCGSDLPEDAAPAPDPRPEPEPEPEPESEDAGAVVEHGAPVERVETATHRRDARWPVVVLAVVAAVLGVLLGRLLLAEDDPATPQGDTPLAKGVEFTSEDAKAGGLSAVVEATEKVLSYSAKTLDEDVEGALPLLDEDMAEQYRSTIDAIREETAENQAVVEASVVAASAISATEHDVKALLFVNQSTTGKHLEVPRADLNRVVVTAHRDSGDWVVTDIEAL